MNTNRMLLATLAGGIAGFLGGFVFYGMLFMNFMKNNAGTATNVMRDDNSMVMWAIFLGNCSWGLLMAYIFERWAGIRTLQQGAVAGAIIGLLAGYGFDFISYGTSNLANMTATLVDPLINAVVMGISGAAVAFALGYNRKD